MEPTSVEGLTPSENASRDIPCGRHGQVAKPSVDEITNFQVTAQVLRPNSCTGRGERMSNESHLQKAANHRGMSMITMASLVAIIRTIIVQLFKNVS